MGYLIAAIAALYLLSQRSALGMSTGIAPAGVPIAPSATLLSSIQSDQQLSGSTIQAGTSALSSIAGSGGALSNVTSSGVANAIPIVGAALAAISSALFAASAKRAAQAKSENAAVAAGVPGWDRAVTTIVSAYNAGSIDAAGVVQLLNQIMANYWSEVGPQIQPGRNGCASGANCPGSANANIGTELATTAPSSYCSGSIGAACCVGCANLQLGVDNMTWAVNNAEKTGQASQAIIPQVFPSKYGGIARASYTVTFTPSSTAFRL